jgi:hypothetical protein
MHLRHLVKLVIELVNSMSQRKNLTSLLPDLPIRVTLVHSHLAEVDLLIPVIQQELRQCPWHLKVVDLFPQELVI